MKIFQSFWHRMHGDAGAYNTRVYTPVKKIVMRLNLAVLVIMITCIQVNASIVNAQNVTVNVKDAPLRTVFETLRKQTGYQFFFDNDVIKKASKVTLQLKVVPLKEALEQLFSQQPLDYEIVEKTIVVTEKTTQPNNPYKQQVITGQVKDQKSQALAGVTVSVKGSSKSTSTDDSGVYRIEAGIDDILIFQFLGYAQHEEALKGRSKLDVILLQSVSQLDQVMIQGYGTTTQRLTTGNIAKVNSETISQQSVMNGLQGLNGRVAGVQVIQNSAIQGSPLSIQIRGVNSLGANNRPLFVVDDVPFPTDPLTSFGFLTQTEPTNIISPNDIESITILKDADATAIYGSRGANGVVLITTKRGKSGKTKLDINLNQGFTAVSNMPKVMSTTQYLQMRRDAFANSAQTPSASTAPDLITWDQNANTDLLDWYYGNTAKLTDATASFSGGSSNTQFFLSGNYRQESNVFSDANKYRRSNLHFSLNHSSVNQKLKLSFSGLYGSDNNKLNNNLSNSLGAIAQAVPNYPYFDVNGNFNWLANLSNAYAVNTAYSKFNNQSINLNLKTIYSITNELNFTLNLGIRNLFNDVISVNPSTAKNPASTVPLGNSAFYTNTNSTAVAEPQLSYDKELFNGKLTLLVGSTIQQSKSRSEQLGLNSYLSDLLMESRNGGSFGSTSSVRSQYNFLSVFGRLNYNWQNRYLINGTFRRDGSGRFGPNKRFGNFGSIGAAWLFSNENFLKDHLSWLSYGKLRGSYGSTGSDGIGDFAYLSLYTTSTDYGTQKAISPSQIANPNYQWEVTKKLEMALDLGFFKDKVLFSTAYYRNRSGNQLVLYPLPATTGFSGYTSNLPAVVQNTGLEFDLNTTNIEKGDFTWKSSLNLTVPKNKLLKFPGIEQTSFANTHVIGKPLKSYLAFQLEGIDANTGLATVLDVSGNGSISTSSSYNNRGGDKIWVGSANPDWYAGLNNSITYKGFQLDFFLQYTKQLGYNLYSAPAMTEFGTLMNGYTAYLDYWKAPGQVASVPKPLASAGNVSLPLFSQSDKTFSDASFLRLKTLALNYQLPASIIKRLKISSLQVFAQGQNLWTITNYEGVDPETAPTAAVSISSLRTVSFGLKASF